MYPVQPIAAKYGTLDNPQPAPELPGGLATTVSIAAVRQILRLLELDAANYGTARWNPLGAPLSNPARASF